jgi:hypothetical protein
MPFETSEAGYRARCRLGGLHGGPKRAAFWRGLGWPNLKRATQARWRGHVPKAKAGAAKEFSPFAMLDDLPPDSRPPWKSAQSVKAAMR